MKKLGVVHMLSNHWRTTRGAQSWGEIHKKRRLLVAEKKNEKYIVRGRKSLFQ
jgi:hypothetical protein